MKNLKIFLTILLCILLLPCIVNAEECNQNSVKLQSIKLKEKSEYTEELTEATIDNNKINLDLKMYDVGDYIEYTLKVKNESDENFYFDEDSLNINSNYFDYSLSYKDNSNKIEPNKEKIIYLKVQYKKEVEKENFFSGKYKDNNIVSLLLTDNKKSFFTNPLTGSNKIILLLISMIILGIYLYYKKTNNIRLNIFIILGLSLLIPISTYALCEVKLDINSNITIGKVKPNPCTYDGELVQGAEYVNGQYTYRYMQEVIFDEWQNIDNDGWGVILTDKESTDDVTTKLCTSINNKAIVSMSYMFSNSQTYKIDLSSFETSNVTNMQSMFNNVKKINELDFSGFDTSNVENIEYMFYGVDNIEKLDLNYFNTSNMLKMRNVFYSEKLKKLNLSGWKNNGISKLQDLIFRGTPIEEINLSNWDNKNINYMDRFFAGDEFPELMKVDLTNFDTSTIVGMRSMFVFSNILKLDLSSFNTSNVTNFDEMFYGSNIEEIIGIENWDLSKITRIYGVFNNCTKLKKLNIKNWNLSKVEGISDMFYNCSSIEELDLSGWNVDSMWEANSLFNGMASLKKLNLSNWKNKVSYFRLGEQLYNSNLDELNLSNWDNTQISSLDGFLKGVNAKKIILDNFDTSTIVNMIYMFENSNVEELDLSSFVTSNVYNMDHMFYNSKVKKIIVSDKFKTDRLPSYGNSMFFGAINLKGGNGTIYDSNNINQDYARIDTPEAPGYFTRK